LMVGDLNGVIFSHDVLRNVKNVCEGVEIIAARSPQRIALEYYNSVRLSPPVLPSTLTYDELNSSANTIAHHLLKYHTHTTRCGACDECNSCREWPVGILMADGPMYVAAVLGVMKAGGVVLPLSLDAPPQRLLHILEETHSTILLTNDDELESMWAERCSRRVWVVSCADFFRNDDNGDDDNDEIGLFMRSLI
jgi:non-ribosomal peptide synthetase component F